MNLFRKNRRGFATVAAMVSLMLIGVTIAGLMTRISTQARRTAAEADRAQQGQIRIARSLDKSVKLPAELNVTTNIHPPISD
jgi:type II secretory pathway component PulK